MPLAEHPSLPAQSGPRLLRGQLLLVWWTVHEVSQHGFRLIYNGGLLVTKGE